MFSATFLHEITLYAIDIDIRKGSEHIFQHSKSRTTLKIGPLPDSTVSYANTSTVHTNTNMYWNVNKFTREKKSSRKRVASSQLNRNGLEEIDYPEIPSGVGRIPDDDDKRRWLKRWFEFRNFQSLLLLILIEWKRT